MDLPFIRDRRSLADAAELIERYGEAAASQAAMLASSSRNAGNVQRFCHWRQIERVIAALSREEPHGAIH
jgi:hypothetical protein